MAELFFGLGSSHGPLLSLPPESWEVRANFDRNNPAMAFRDGTYDFRALLEARKDDRKFFASQNTAEVRTERFERCQKHLDDLGDRLEEADPDILVVVGDDQKEWFSEDSQPSFAVYCGEEMVNLAYNEEERKKMIEGGRESMLYAYRPKKDQAYPVASELALHIINQAIEDEFDVTACMEQPRTPNGLRSAGHAYGYIYRRIVRDKPIPIVPILNNTFYPPNQPTPKRCFEFGCSIGRAIRSWEADLSVGVIASGGITHFVVDEEWDNKMLKALQERDTATLTNEPNIIFRDGTSETKNWITVAGMLDDGDLEMDLLDYVPCYRTEAGTGSGMGFAVWK